MDDDIVMMNITDEELFNEVVGTSVPILAAKEMNKVEIEQVIKVYLTHHNINDITIGSIWKHIKNEINAPKEWKKQVKDIIKNVVQQQQQQQQVSTTEDSQSTTLPTKVDMTTDEIDIEIKNYLNSVQDINNTGLKKVWKHMKKKLNNAHQHKKYIETSCLSIFQAMMSVSKEEEQQD